MDELSSRFSALHRPGMPGTYYLEPAESGCIGLTRIDAGHSGRWDRIVESVRDDIALHRSLPGFRQLIQSRRFEITVLIVLPTKAKRIASAFQSLPEVKHVANHNLRNEVWFNVTVSRLYRDGDRWQDTTSYRRDDLPIVSKVVNMAYVWIWDQDATFIPDRAVG